MNGVGEEDEVGNVFEVGVVVPKRVNGSVVDGDGEFDAVDLMVAEFRKAGFVVEVVPGVTNEFIKLAAPMDTLGAAAAELQIKKQTYIGLDLPFEKEQVDAFVKQTDGSLFSWCERYRCYRHLIYGIVNNSESNLLLRFEDKQFCWEPQESLLQTCESRGIVKQAFPLHDEKRRKQLIRSWALNWWDCTTQPIDDVQLYFGTKIALYFAFLAMYTRWLFFPAALGIILQLVNFGSLQFLVLPIFFTSVISWAVFFFQFWKRKNFALLTRWRIPYTIGTGPGFKILGMEWNPLHYPAETGKKSQADHVKEKQIYQRHEWFTRIKRFRNDAIIILSIICLQLPFELAYAHLYEIIESSTIKFILTAVYLLLIQYFTRIGGKISVNLIRDEKVENSENRADSLVYKVFGLYFMQTYIGIFYHALLHRNIETLRQVLKQRLIVSEVFDNLLENSLPFLKYSFKKYGAVRNRRKGQKASSRDKVQFTSRVEKEYLKPDYAASTGAELEDGLFDDFLELTLQFGMIMMFACAFPLAFVFAAVNNIMEIRTDALKLLTIFKRPVPRSTATIGAWLSIFQFLIVLSICTNCALLVCLYDAEGNWKLEPGLAAILIIEHVLLLIKFGFSRLVPEEPAWVRANRMKNVTNAQDVCSKQLLRNISNKEMSRQEKVE